MAKHKSKPKDDGIERGYAFGSIKGNVIRILSKGYRPEWGFLTAKLSDRERIKTFAKAQKTTILDAITLLCDMAGLPKVKDAQPKNGRVAPLVALIASHSKRRNPEDILAEIKRGDHDELIRKWMDIEVR